MSDVPGKGSSASSRPLASKTFELPTFLGETVPVEFAARLREVRLEESALVMVCDTHHHEPVLHDYYGTICETTFQPPKPSRPLTVRLDAVTDEIVRLRYAPGEGVPDVQTPMVVGTFSGPTHFEVVEMEGAVVIETAALRIEVVREPWQLKVYDLHENLVFATKPVDIEPLRRPEDQWNPAEQRWLFLHRYAYPLGVTRAGSPRVFASFDLAHDERVYGFGESYGKLDKTGTQQMLWLQEVFSNAAPAAYKQTPFFMSTRGYGLFVNTSNALRYLVGSLEHTALSVTVEDTEAFDAYLIYGPTFKDVLPRYTDLTGKPGLPPKWSFGLWMGRISYNRQAQVEEVAGELREHRIPCDVIHIDTDWYEHDWACDLEFGPSKFPDPAGMIRTLRERGLRVCLWQWPNMLVNTRMFAEGHERGYLAKTANGKTHLYTGFMESGGFIDYSHPEAVAWVQEKFRRLFELGVPVIKTDFGEGAPPGASYHGVPSEAMHNLYPLLYNRAVFGVTEEVWGEGQGVVWSRSAWAGSQRYPVHWSGDGVARFEDLPCVLRATLSFGLSGFPFYSHDIGGFSGLPSPELYVRWAQLGLLSSHARAHGTPPREPWAYGREAEDIFRRYTELRYRLLPYLYSEAVEGVRTSLPVVRALVLEHPDDPTAAFVDDQYYFGRNLLVAPILTERNARRVYLPHGRWVDFWNKEALEGGRWLEVEAPLDTVPMFVRAGAVLPYGPVVQYVDETPCDPLTLELYLPEGEGAYVVHDQGRPDLPVRYRRDGGTLTVEVGAAPGEVVLTLFGAAIREARIGERPLSVEHAQTVRFDGRTPQTVTLDLA